MTRRPIFLLFRDVTIAVVAAVLIITLWEMVFEDLVHQSLFGRDSPLTTGERWLDVLAVVVAVGTSALVLGLVRSRAQKAEEELRQSEARLTEALRIARLGHWEYDVATDTTWWPEQTCRLFGVPVEDGAPNHAEFLELLPKKDRAPMADAIVQAIKHGTPFSIEHGVLREGEPDRIFVSEGEAFRDGAGNVVRLAGTNRDITKSKRTEDALQDAHDDLERRVDERTHEIRTTLETLVAGVITISDRGEIEAFSPSAESLFGYTAEEVIGQNVTILMTDEDSNAHSRHLDRYRETGEAVIIGRGREVEGRRKDGSIFPLHLSVGEMSLAGQRKFQDITERREAESALIDSEAHLKTLTEMSPVGIFRANKDGNVTHVNDRCKEILGTWDENLLLGNNWIGFVHPEDLPRITEEYYPELQRQDALRFEWRVAHRDPPVWVISQAQPEKDEAGNLTGYVGSLIDVPLQKQAELALSQSEERFRAIIENTSDFVVILDEDNNRTYVSPSIEAATGLPKEELLGISVYEYVHEDGQVALAEAITKAKENPGRSQFLPEIRVTMPNAPTIFREVLVTSLLDLPGVHGIVLSSRDITERKLMEQEAEESRVRMAELRRRLDDAVESFTDGFILFDADDRIVMCNSAYRNDCLPIADYLEPGTRFEDFVRAMYASDEIVGDPYRTEQKIEERIEVHEHPELGPWIAPLAGDRWILVNEYKTHDGGTALIRSDITDRVKAEQETVLARKQAEAANKAKSEFLSSMSHELRTPMNAILGFAQLLEQDPAAGLKETHRNFVAEILRSGHHMMELINGVLDLAKIESGGVAFDMSACEPRPLIESCLKMVEASASESQISVECRYPNNGLPPIEIDVLRFKQAVLNLLSNAIKYNRPGGNVVIECRPYGHQSLRVSVSDTGVGIPDHLQAKVFEPFDRLGAESSDVLGTGIGLTVTKQLIEGMAGTVGFESTVGEGTTFWIDLPVASVAASQLPN